MKRKLVLLLAVTMVLTGCSAAQPEKQTPNAPLGESETISPETEYTVFPTETDSTLIPEDAFTTPETLMQDLNTDRRWQLCFLRTRLLKNNRAIDHRQLSTLR